VKSRKSSRKPSRKSKPIKIKVQFVTAERQWEAADYRTGPVRPYPDERGGLKVTRRYHASSGESPIRGIRLDQSAIQHANRKKAYIPARKPKNIKITYAMLLAAQLGPLAGMKAASTNMKF